MNEDNKQPPFDLKVRTRQFAVRIIRLYCALPNTTVAQTVGKQILRPGTLVGAQYREGYRSRSDAEIVSKWGGALQELEETLYWLEVMVEAEVVPEARLADLTRDCGELIAIITASIKTVKARSHG